MKLVLTNTVLLPFALLVLGPLIVHLFARARPPVFRFSSVEFLQRVLRKTIRLKKPQSILVLLLRTLLFAALILAFLKPVFFGAAPLGGAGTQKHVAIVVDATASMAGVEGTQTRFAMACAKASEILFELRGADTANLIWMAAPNRAEFPQLGVNFDYLKRALREARVATSAADIRAAINLAVEMLKDREGTRQIYLLSDFQQSTWGNATASLPADVQLFAIKIGQSDPPNQAIETITVHPASPLVGEEVSVVCQVNNFSGEHKLSTVFLRAGSGHQTRDVPLAPWEKVSVGFQVKFNAPGEQSVALALSEDGFPYDNERWAVVEVIEHLRVGLYAGEGPGDGPSGRGASTHTATAAETAAYWRRALHALGWARIENVTDERIEQLLNFDALFLAGWVPRGAAAERVRAFITQGGTVVWFPSISGQTAPVSGVTNSPRATNNAIATLLQAGQGSAEFAWQTATNSWRVRIADPAYPPFKIFSAAGLGEPVRAGFRARLAWRTEDLPEAKSVLAYQDGVPALLQFRDQGTLLLWNLPLAAHCTDWPRQAEFLPLLGELLLHHRHRPVVTRESAPGQMLARQFEAGVAATDVRLLRGEMRVPLKRATGSEGLFASGDLQIPGLYEWQYRGSPLALQVVNFPAIESDLRTQSPTTFGHEAAVALTGAQSIKQLKEGSALWPALLALALVAALVEGLVLVAARQGRRTTAGQEDAK